MLVTHSNTPIKFTVVVGSQEYALETFPGEYRSLMMLIYDKIFPDDFGECKGIGRCGTCHVYVSNADNLSTRIANEDTTLSKMSLVTAHSRLSCQVPIDFRLHGITIELVSEGE